MKMNRKNQATNRFLIYMPVIVILFCLVAVGASTIARKGAQHNKPDKRAAKVAELRAILHDEQLHKDDPKRVLEAIRQLGDERAVEAVPELVQHLGFERMFTWQEEAIEVITMGRQYPAISALFQIGEDALPALIGFIESNDENSLASKNATYTVFAIFRKQPTEGVKLLENAAARAASPQAALRLNKAAERNKKQIAPASQK